MSSWSSEELVLWTYRVLLGRDPEHGAIKNNPFNNDIASFVESVLASPEYHAKSRTQRTALPPPPFMSWERDAIAFIHLPKTGGTTLSNLLSACFPADRVCPQNFHCLHHYPPAELAKYDLFSGHFDYFSLRFIPRRRVRRISVFRDPAQRLISWYRFCRSHPASGHYLDETPIRLAQELDPEEYFEHPYAVGSPYHNNAGLFFFGSSLDDSETLKALTTETDAALNEVLKQAIARITELDAIGISERFDESVGVMFSALALPVPKNIVSARVTDDLAERDPRFKRVPPVEMTPRLQSALERLTRYDRVIYDAARKEFELREHRLARARQEKLAAPASPLTFT